MKKDSRKTPLSFCKTSKSFAKRQWSFAKPLSLLRKDSGVLQKAERVFSRTLELKDAVFFSSPSHLPISIAKIQIFHFGLIAKRECKKRSLPTFHHSYLFF